jgi:biopolymer transport protein ExbD
MRRLRSVFQEEEKPELIIVPMVDVMLFLLAFFVLIAGSIIPGLSLKVNPPKTFQKVSVERENKIITVVIKKDGSFWYKGKKFSFTALVYLLRNLKRKDPNIFLAINADKDANIQSLIDVLDAGQKAGISSIGIVAKGRHESIP